MVQCTHDGAATNAQRMKEQRLFIKEELVQPIITTEEEHPTISACPVTQTMTYSQQGQVSRGTVIFMGLNTKTLHLAMPNMTSMYLVQYAWPEEGILCS